MNTEKGEMEIELFDEDAPNTVKNFVSLVESGFYNGLTFHRCIPDFVVQGGDPLGNGTGGPGYRIPCETQNNRHKHEIGALSMAHAGKDTGGSQFFIVRAPQPHLDGVHTVFGKVISGLDVIYELRNGDKMTKVEAIEVSDKIRDMELTKFNS